MFCLLYYGLSILGAGTKLTWVHVLDIHVIVTLYWVIYDKYEKQEESARERALCQLTECF